MRCCTWAVRRDDCRYLISTADGVGIPVFDWFEVPALVSDLPDQADTAGAIHLYLAWGLVILPSCMPWQL